MKIYLAGPLFTTAEQEFNRALGRALADSGYEVWLPQEHEPREKTARTIFEKDLEGLKWAEVLVANMDGPDPDSGTCWECGYVFMKIPVVLFRTDFRQAGDAANTPFNLMMSESAAATLLLPLASPEQVATEICAHWRGSEDALPIVQRDLASLRLKSAIVITVEVAIVVAVPIVIAVPIAVCPPLMPVRIVPGVSFRPATVPFSVEFCLRFFGLVAVFSVFTNFMAKVFFRLLDFVLTSAPAIVGGRFGCCRNH